MWQFLASQLRSPNGWFGSLLMGRLLNRTNERIIRATIALLEVKPEHHVLEVGFGGGSALSQLTKRGGAGMTAGLELSPEMMHRAERRFRQEIAAGQLQVVLGEAGALPFPDAVFNRVFTINTVYFWPDVMQGLAEMHRVLKYDGVAAVSIRSKEKMEKHAVTRYGFRLFSPEDIAGLMQRAGFCNIRVDHRDRDKWYDQVIVLGSRL